MLITETVPALLFVTNADVPSGVKATPSGLLPLRSVGPEPGMMIATGAFGPPSGDDWKPVTSQGPQMSTVSLWPRGRARRSC